MLAMDTAVLHLFSPPPSPFPSCRGTKIGSVGPGGWGGEGGGVMGLQLTLPAVR